MSADYGFVYVLQNEAMNGYYKIGMTRRAPHARAEELSAPTGIPYAFKVAYYAEVENPQQVERFLHDGFSDCRTEGREFFRCKLRDIIEAIRGTGAVELEAESDYAFEAFNPGTVCSPRTPLCFESSLHDPAYLASITRMRLGGKA